MNCPTARLQKYVYCSRKRVIWEQTQLVQRVFSCLRARQYRNSPLFWRLGNSRTARRVGAPRRQAGWAPSCAGCLVTVAPRRSGLPRARVPRNAQGWTRPAPARGVTQRQPIPMAGAWMSTWTFSARSVVDRSLVCIVCQWEQKSGLTPRSNHKSLRNLNKTVSVNILSRP